MDKRMKGQKHSVEQIFSLLLFTTFAITMLLLVLFGTRIYAENAKKLNTADAPVLLAYLTEKMRTLGTADELELRGKDRMVLRDDEQEDLITWIYVEDGMLKETLTGVEGEPVPGMGTVIGEIREFSIETDDTGMVIFELTDQFGNHGVRYYSPGR